MLKNLKNKLRITLTAVIALTFVYGCGGDKPSQGSSEKNTTAQDDNLTIAFVGYSSTNPFWIQVRNAVRSQVREMDHKFIDLTSSQPDVMMQKQAFDNAVARDVDGIILGAVDNRAFNDSLNKAKNKGIPVIAVDTAIDHPWISSVIQTNNVKSAKLAGNYIVDQGKEDKVLILGGAEGHQTADARRKGVEQVIKKAGGEVIFQACDWKPDKAYETATSQLTAHPDITAIFAACDPMARSAVSAVEQKADLDNIVIIGFDGDPANLKMIAEGIQDADVKQKSEKMGRQSVQRLVKVIEGEKVEPKSTITGTLVTSENVQQYLENADS